MPCSGYGPLRGAVLPGARPGLARNPWVGAVVTAQDTVQASSARPRWSCHQVGSTNGSSSGTRLLRAAGWLWAPPSQVGESTRRPRQAPRRQQRRQRQWHHRHPCSHVWFKRFQGVQQVCSSSTVVSAGSTVRLNRLHRLQPCTVERHLPTTAWPATKGAVQCKKASPSYTLNRIPPLLRFTCLLAFSAVDRQ